MTNKPQSPDEPRVRALLEQYGASLERFPEAEREAAAALIAQTPSLQALQAQVAELDAWLAAPTPTGPSADLRRRVAEIPLRYPRAPARGFLGLVLGGRLALRLSAAFVIAATLGVASGLALADEFSARTQTIATDDEGWEELETLAFSDSLLFEDLDSNTLGTAATQGSDP